jgi:hypothetical protein
MFENINKDNPVIAWWSGGADSAIVCWLCIKWFKKENVRIVFIDTGNENADTYRFKTDCENAWGIKIETIRSSKWDSIWDIWRHYISLNVATGAICSTELKRVVRQDFQNKNAFSYQAFGFDVDEIERAEGMKSNYPDSCPIFPLIYELVKKGKSIRMLQKQGIEPPLSYRMGYSNNNCLETGCVKGGIGYWQKYKIDFTDNFFIMAYFEHELSELKGEPVTICKDQSKAAKARNGGKAELVFLIHNPKFPNVKDISMMKGKMPEPLMECNGFCGTKKPIVGTKSLIET